MRTKSRTLLRNVLHYLPFGCFVVAMFCLCFAYGLMVGRYQVCPYGFLRDTWRSARVTAEKLYRDTTRLSLRNPTFLFPARYEGQGVVGYKPRDAFPGVTLLTGPWKNTTDWSPGIRLINLDGEVLHEWQTDPRAIWRKSPYDDYAAGSKDDKTETHVHGALLLPNGDVVFNLEFFGLVKMNAVSEVVWKLPYRTHHSIFEDSDGHYWVCGMKYHEKNIPKYVGLKPPFVEDMILRVSPKGVVEREISLLQVIYNSGYDGILRWHDGDILHLNDVEVLSEYKADAFDLFQAGDIMVSMCRINTVVVIDGNTERIKWSLRYPFIGQHDPDFTQEGYITVFDNHQDWWRPEYQKQGSRIIGIEPSTKKITVLYGWKTNQYFCTLRGGKHQHLSNGNMLITEAAAGRVFEVSANGEVVWSWIAPRWDEGKVPEILEGTRYGTEYANFTNVARKDEK